MGGIRKEDKEGRRKGGREEGKADKECREEGNYLCSSLTSCPKALPSEAAGVTPSMKPKTPLLPLALFSGSKIMLFADWTLLQSSGCQNTAHKTQFHTKMKPIK